MEADVMGEERQAPPSGGEASRAIATKRQNEANLAKKDDLSFPELDDTPIFSSNGVIRHYFGRERRYWIEYRDELNFGMQTVLDNASVIGVLREQGSAGDAPGSTVRLDLTRQRLLLCSQYITRWAVPPDKNGKEIKWPRHPNDRIEAIKNLNVKWGEAIVRVITEHVAAQQEEEEAAQQDMDTAAQLGEEDRDRDDSPPQPSQNGELVVDAQPLQSASSPVGASVD